MLHSERRYFRNGTEWRNCFSGFFFISQTLLQLDKYSTVYGSTVNNQKIITSLIPATRFQSGKSKTSNLDCRGTTLYANYVH